MNERELFELLTSIEMQAMDTRYRFRMPANSQIYVQVPSQIFEQIPQSMLDWMLKKYHVCISITDSWKHPTNGAGEDELG